jgi:uncharacterized protein with PIN domain
MAVKVRISFEGDLRELLDKEQRGNESGLEIGFNGKRPVKDLVQSLGVPHTEIGKIKADQREVDFNYIVQHNDTLEVWPVSAESFEGNKPGRFLCDVHLWKLARRLRLLGFDTAFNPEWEDAELAEVSYEEKRMLLSRDRGLLMRNKVEMGLLIRHTDPEQQVKEVLERLGIGEWVRPFSRCTVCNGLFETVDTGSSSFKDTLSSQIPPGVRQWCTEYQYCTSCGKVFWKGSHYKKLMAKIKSLEISI